MLESINQEQIKTIVEEVETPCFVYDESTLKRNVNRILENAADNGLDDRIQIYVSYFANSNPHLHKIVCGVRDNVGILLQSLSEFQQVSSYFGEENLPKMIASPSVLSLEEHNKWKSTGVQLNVSSLEEVKMLSTVDPQQAIDVRIDLSKNRKQRLGIKRGEIPELKRLISEGHLKLEGFHMYAGTGSSLDKMLKETEEAIIYSSKHFPSLQILNLGGGFDFDYDCFCDGDAKHFDWSTYFQRLAYLLDKYRISKNVQIYIEPGRDIFADSALFLLGIKNKKVWKKGVKDLCVDGSYVHMPSAMIRRRQHRVQFFNKEGRIMEKEGAKVRLAGATTLSRDFIFPGVIDAPNVRPAYVGVGDVGAYGATQFLRFLNQRSAPEVLITEKGDLKLLTQRGGDEDGLMRVLRNPTNISKNVVTKIPDLYRDPEGYKKGPYGMENETLMWHMAGALLLKEVLRINAGFAHGGLENASGVVTAETVLSKKIQVLDVCSGPGTFPDHLSLYIKNLVATCVDSSRSMLEMGRRKHAIQGWRFVEDDVVKMDLGKKFPIITASSAYHHILDENKIAFLENLKKHLLPDGVVLLCENFLPHYESPASRKKAVADYYNALECYYAVGNATPEAIEVIKEVRKLEESGIEEHKVSYEMFLKHLEITGLSIKTAIQVWNPNISYDFKAGSYVVVLKAF
ncbi:methyltransferase domain-containing protein [Candidatus Peregrinibacteria bacterium]|nr:methyltransferase domain-containing protein [Candidatus Peregrinibacteria bacterium]